ncbi:MAG: aminopeptidase P family protein, partial [Rhodospirillales bacterium]|nr:aminopeptidase P family protein [Rhodospirillales bacterium]
MNRAPLPHAPTAQARLATLSRSLARAGSRLDGNAVRALVRGLAAAPATGLGAAEARLLAPRPTPGLIRELARLVAAERAHMDRAFRSRPAPAIRLARLRREMKKQNLDGFVVPRGDEHQSEYAPRSADRLAWLTGFTGSAGTAVVLRDKAALLIDGRYTLQARAEADPRLYRVRSSADTTPGNWFAAEAKPKARVGYDPWLLSQSQARALRAALAPIQGQAVACARNPLDADWRDRPPAPISPARVHPPRYAGTTSSAKRARMARELRRGGADALILTLPDSIAWLLNVRGGDVPHTPLPLAFAVLHADGKVDLFVDERKLTPPVRRHLGRGTRIRPSEDLGPALDALARAGRRVRACPDTASAWIFDRLARAKGAIVPGPDPCQAAKAAKTAAELAGIRRAHRRDGAALVRFLAWLARETPKKGVDEIAAARKLETFRAEDTNFQGPSFPTISGAGPHGAVVHYRVSEKTNRPLRAGELYLVDSGGQYPDGTTDVTRTVAIGRPSAEMRDRFTRVLKGHIAVAMLVFPDGTAGQQLDAFARAALWRAGLDYEHGTGHGVGHFLGVHEGPQRIAKSGNAVALRPGMVVSDEPGYYKTGAFGIRIENLVTVVPVDL